MDNVTHSIIGLAVGEAAVALGALGGVREPREAAAARVLLLTVSVLANNVPDSDLLLTWLTPGTLGYLLHHRGHTHVLLAALPLGLLAVLLGACLRVFPRWRGLPRKVWAWAAGLAVGGVGLHVAADGMNSYGVHPFWPFWNGWLYGDSVFIVEPLFWATLGVFFASRARSRSGRLFPWVLLAAALALGFGMGVMNAVSAGVLVGMAAVAAVVFRALSRRGRVGAHVTAAVAFAALVVGSFFAGSHLAAGKAASAVGAWREGRGERGTTHDVVVDPFPSHPLCWAFLSVETIAPGAGGELRYLVRSGRLALLPAVVPLAACPSRGGEGLASEEPPADARESEGVVVDAQWSAPLSAMKERARDCRVAAWLRFARVPFYVGSEAHDLRYSRRGGRAFSTLDLAAEPGGCPGNVPNWTPPRGDLFGEERGR